MYIYIVFMETSQKEFQIISYWSCLRDAEISSEKYPNSLIKKIRLNTEESI